MQASTAATVRVGRLIGTTDQKIAKKIGEIVEIEKITGGTPCRMDRTDDGTIEFMHHGELFEVMEVVA